MRTTQSFWCIEQHRKTNHYYDDYLPYEFHLRMVNEVYETYKHLLDDEFNYYGEDKLWGPRVERVTLRQACGDAVWGHDLYEDCRLSYNNIKAELGQEAADIIFAVSNEKGKTRQEKANDKYYEGIVATPGAVFVKLCDRIANVQYSKLTKSRMFETYQKENQHFVNKLGWEGKTTHPYSLMFLYLIELFK